MSGPQSELQLLGELNMSLIDLGFASQLHRRLPGLMIGTDSPNLFVWVFVGASGRTFTWRRDDSMHPVDDVSGAAVQIARFVTAQSGRVNGSPG